MTFPLGDSVADVYRGRRALQTVYRSVITQECVASLSVKLNTGTASCHGYGLLRGNDVLVSAEYYLSHTISNRHALLTALIITMPVTLGILSRSIYV